MSKDRLALGCGDKYHGDQWLHLDISDLEHVDKVHDLETGELPFEDDRFVEVKAVHILEHLTQDSLISILKEINRVAVTGARIQIVLPHFLSWNAADVDHYRAGSRNSFVQFTESYGMNSPYPTLFRNETVTYDFLSNPLVTLGKYLLGRQKAAAFIPNAVNEIRYDYRNI